MRAVVAVLVVALIAVSCGDDTILQSTTAAPTTEAAATTTPATTGAPATTATTAAPTTTTTTIAAPAYPIAVNGAGHPEHPPILGAAGDPDGSGCVPGGDVLPDGIWFGFAQEVNEGVISFDLGCFFSEPAASAAAAADGYGDVEDGYYIRNQNPRVFAVPIAGTADVYWVDGGPTADRFPQPLPQASWPSSNSWLPCPSDSCAIWVYVNGGVATGIVEQYLP